MGKIARAAVYSVAAMTVVVTVLRTVPMTYVPERFLDDVLRSWFVIGLIAVTVIAAIVYSYCRCKTVLPAFSGRSLTAVGWLFMGLGAALIVSELLDVYWLYMDNSGLVSNLSDTGTVNRMTQIGTVVCGLFAGWCGIRQGWRWVSANRFVAGEYRLLTLFLPLWLWMRLAQYVMSYASAVSVTESFYDYAMRIVSLLFAMSFARYVAGFSNYRSPAFLWQALATVLCGVSATVTRFVMYLLGDIEAYRGANATFCDFALALFAGGVAVALLCGKHPVRTVEESDDSLNESESTCREETQE